MEAPLRKNGQAGWTLRIPHPVKLLLDWVSVGRVPTEQWMLQEHLISANPWPKGFTALWELHALTFPMLCLQGKRWFLGMKLSNHSHCQLWVSLGELCLQRKKRKRLCFWTVASARLRECFCMSTEGAVCREGCTDKACLLPTAHRGPAEGAGAPAAVQAGMWTSWTWEKLFLQLEWIQCQNQRGGNGAWNKTAEAGEQGKASQSTSNGQEDLEKCKRKHPAYRFCPLLLTQAQEPHCICAGLLCTGDVNCAPGKLR